MLIITYIMYFINLNSNYCELFTSFRYFLLIVVKNKFNTTYKYNTN